LLNLLVIEFSLGLERRGVLVSILDEHKGRIAENNLVPDVPTRGASPVPVLDPLPRLICAVGFHGPEKRLSHGAFLHLDELELTHSDEPPYVGNEIGKCGGGSEQYSNFTFVRVV
jgi:hypothetical protein